MVPTPRLPPNVFSTLFQIPVGYVPATSSFRMRVAADNQVTQVRLNGTVLGFSWVNPVTYDSFSGFSPYYTVTGLVRGENNLAFDVWNGAQDSPGNIGNPAGLRVEFAESEMIPNPEPDDLRVPRIDFDIRHASLRFSAAPMS